MKTIWQFFFWTVPLLALMAPWYLGVSIKDMPADASSLVTVTYVAIDVMLILFACAVKTIHVGYVVRVGDRWFNGVATEDNKDQQMAVTVADKENAMIIFDKEDAEIIVNGIQSDEPKSIEKVLYLKR